MMEKKIVLRTIVANAAVGCDYGTNIPSVEIAEKTLKTNVVATIKFIKIFLPLLAVDGRVVIVSSKMGQLNVMSEWVRSVLEDVNIT